MTSPEFVESLTLGVATSWMIRLYMRVGLKALLFSASYLLFPAVGLMLEAADALPVQIETVKWVATIVNIVLTIAFIRLTWHEESSTSLLLTEIHAKDQEIKLMHAALEEARRTHDEEVAHALAASNAMRVRQLLAEVSSG